MLNLEDEHTSLKSLLTNAQGNFSRANSEENLRAGHFKLITGKNDPTTFLPLSAKMGGQINNNNNNNKPNASQYLTKEQANHVYKKTESGKIINTETLHQEIEQEQQLN